MHANVRACIGSERNDTARVKLASALDMLSHRMSRARMRPTRAGTLLLLAPLVFSACGGRARLPLAAGVGPNPELPAPERSLIPTLDIAEAKRWSGTEHPTAAAGLEVNAFARDLDHPRWLYVLPNGDVLVAETNAPPQPDDNPGIKGWFRKRFMKKAGGAVPSANRITLLRDVDGDGVAETRTPFLTGQRSPFGMVLVGNTLYVANTDAVDGFPYAEGATSITAAGTRVVSLPAGEINHHWTKSLTASRDGAKLYVGVGSNSNVAERGMEAEAERAAIWEIDRATGAHRVFASGLRNPVGITFEPESGALWTAVNERDELGSDLVPDYMTRVQDGGFYGWPYSYYGDHVDPRLKPPRADLVQRAIMPDYALGAHTASLGLAFSRAGALPAAFQRGAFVGQHGSWNRKPQSGYKVVFVPFVNGKPAGQPIDVLTDFLDRDGKARGRPVGVILDRQGALLVADDVGNTIWRVKGSSASAAGPGGPSATEAEEPVHIAPAVTRVSQDSAPPARRCFRGRPLPRCRSFWLTEASYSWRVAGTSRRYDNPPLLVPIKDLDSHLSWDIGYMRNVDARQAWGGTFMAGTGDAGVRLAVKSRYRLWLDDRNSLDVSLGVLSAGVRQPTFPSVQRGVGLTGDVTLGFGDYVGVTGRIETVRAHNRTATALHGGIRLGSYPAIVASAIGGIGLMVLILSFFGTD